MEKLFIACNGIEATLLLQLPGATRPAIKPQNEKSLWTIDFDVTIGGRTFNFRVMDVHGHAEPKIYAHLLEIFEQWHEKGESNGD